MKLAHPLVTPAVLAAALLAAGAVRAGARSALDLTLRTRAATILRFEPLGMELALANSGSEPVTTTTGLERLGVEVSLFVAFEGEGFHEWKRGWLPDVEALPLRESVLAPGASVTATLECFWQEGLPIFDRVGTYRVKAVWNGSAGSARSDPVEITVIGGDPADEACLGALVRDGWITYLAIEGADLLPAEVDERGKVCAGLLGIAGAYPTSRYADYCLVTLLVASGARRLPDDLRARVLSLATDRASARPGARLFYGLAREALQRDPVRAKRWLGRALASNPGPHVERVCRALLDRLEERSR